ncbi:MAG: hypothetical protein ChlgKO_06850 [Chlamydiales bacterium]
MLAMDMPDVEIVQEISNKQQLAADVLYIDLQQSPLMSQMVQAFSIMLIAKENKEADQVEVTQRVKEKLDKTYFYGFTNTLENEFNEEELQQIAEILSLDVMKKYNSKYLKIWTPVVQNIQQVITEVLDSYPNKVAVEDALSSITSENFQLEVVESNLPVVIDCFATWCGPCKAMTPILSEMKEKYEGKIKFVKLDVDKDNPLAKSLGVSSMPTFIIYKDGGAIAQKVGSMDKETFEAWLNDNC